MENPNNQNENIERKYLNKIQKNNLLELKKDCIEFKDRELEDREVNVKRVIKELCLNQLLCL